MVGTAAFLTAWLSINFGLPWWTLPPIGMVVGMLFGGILALPALRLDGFYYALLTLGLNELCRVYFVTSKQFGSATGGLYGASTYINSELAGADPGRGFLLRGMRAAASQSLFLFRFVDGRHLGRILRMAPEKREAFAEATGVNYKRARVIVFLVSSVALGFIGGFYTAQYRGVAYAIFGFDTVLLGPRDADDRRHRSSGRGRGGHPHRHRSRQGLEHPRAHPARHDRAFDAAVVIFLRNGLFGIKQQFRAWRDKKKGEWRSSRTEKGGEALPEEATEIDDKDALYARRFDKMQRDFLKTLVCDEVIEEHRKKPLGQHSEALERLLLYFRRVPQIDKYAIKRRPAKPALRDRCVLRCSRNGSRDLWRIRNTKAWKKPITACSGGEFMISSSPDDRDDHYREFFRRKQREYLRTVISTKSSPSTANHPRGQHSEPLERLLSYFRHAPLKGKHVVTRSEKSRSVPDRPVVRRTQRAAQGRK